ncbi:MAG: hypothetical protein ABFS08_09785 [Pseudomonadota bacterium]
MLPAGVEGFLAHNSKMNLSPISDGEMVHMSGIMDFNISYNGYPSVKTEYEISISIPEEYPKQPPIFKEISDRIPKKPEYHINWDDSLCLGSPLRLTISLKECSDFEVYCHNNLYPYIYAVTLKITQGVDWVFGELAHGTKGEIEDYAEIFGMEGEGKVLDCLAAVYKKKRIANKHPCPCGCSLRLGKCPLHLRINRFRYQVGRIYAGTAWRKLKS